MSGRACVRDTPRIGIGRDVHTSHAHPPPAALARRLARPPTACRAHPPPHPPHPPRPDRRRPPRHHPSCRWHSSTHRSRIEFRFATRTRGVLSRKRIRELGHWTNTGLSVHSVFPSPVRTPSIRLHDDALLDTWNFFRYHKLPVFCNEIARIEAPAARAAGIEGVVFGN